MLVLCRFCRTRPRLVPSGDVLKKGACTTLEKIRSCTVLALPNSAAVLPGAPELPVSFGDSSRAPRSSCGCPGSLPRHPGSCRELPGAPQSSRVSTSIPGSSPWELPGSPLELLGVGRDGPQVSQNLLLRTSREPPWVPGKGEFKNTPENWRKPKYFCKFGFLILA